MSSQSCTYGQLSYTRQNMKRVDLFLCHVMQAQWIEFCSKNFGAMHHRYRSMYSSNIVVTVTVITINPHRSSVIITCYRTTFLWFWEWIHGWKCIWQSTKLQVNQEHYGKSIMKCYIWRSNAYNVCRSVWVHMSMEFHTLSSQIQYRCYFPIGTVDQGIGCIASLTILTSVLVYIQLS